MKLHNVEIKVVFTISVFLLLKEGSGSAQIIQIQKAQNLTAADPEHGLKQLLQMCIPLFAFQRKILSFTDQVVTGYTTIDNVDTDVKGGKYCKIVCVIALNSWARITYTH
jgi:hypothetical protein